MTAAIAAVVLVAVAAALIWLCIRDARREQARRDAIRRHPLNGEFRRRFE